MDKELKYNASGYYDQTAYKAIINVMKGENMKDRTGEIWNIEARNGSQFNAIVIADDGNIATVIRLIECEDDNSDFSIRCKCMMYGCSRMIQYAFVQDLSEYIRTASDEEMQEVKNKILCSLGLTENMYVCKDFDDDMIESLKESVARMEATIQAEPNVINEHIETMKTQLERTNAQLEVYKKLYDDMMQKMIERGA